MGNYSSSQNSCVSVCVVSGKEFIIDGPNRFDEFDSPDLSIEVGDIDLSQLLTMAETSGSNINSNALQEVITKYSQNEMKGDMFMNLSSLDPSAHHSSGLCGWILLGDLLHTGLGKNLPNAHVALDGELFLQKAAGVDTFETEMSESFAAHFKCLTNHQLCGMPFIGPGWRPKETQRLLIRVNVSVGWTGLNPLAFSTISRPQSQLWEQLISDEPSKDVSIVIENNAELRCHGFVLQSASPVLKAMLTPSTGMTESTTRRIELKGMSYDCVKVLLNYLYGVEISLNALSSDVVTELFQSAHEYALSPLENGIMKSLLQKDSQWFGADGAMELYFFTRNVDMHARLKDHILYQMTKMYEEVLQCERFKELDKKEAVELLKQLWAVNFRT